MPLAGETRRGVDELLSRLDKLHSSPTVALRVMELTRDEEFEMADVVACLENDPALASSILRLVNSSYYGLNQDVMSLQHALAYLGRRSLRLTVLTFGLVKTLVSGAPALCHQQYWKRSLTMASAARQLSQTTGHAKNESETAFAAGLMADLGMLVLAQLETEKYVEIAQEPDHIMQLVERERNAFGFDHMAVSKRLLTRWQLPEALVDAVANHHHYLPAAPRLNQVLLSANLISEVIWTPASAYMQPLQHVLANRFELGIDDLITLTVNCKEAVAGSVDVFGVRVEGEIDLEEIEVQARAQFADAAADRCDDEADLGPFLDGPLLEDLDAMPSPLAAKQ